MKRWLGVLALLLLLSGCADTAPQDNQNGELLSPPEAPDLVAPELYDPTDPMEDLTAGAVKAYPMKDGKCLSVVPMGKRLLLFTENGVRLLRGERLTQIASAEIPGIPTPESGMLQVRDDGIAYYDAKGGQIVFLNTLLTQVGTVQLPEEIVGDVYLAEDWDHLYYCSEAGVHVMDLRTGVCRLLLAQNSAWQGISGGFLNGKVLRCTIRQENGTDRTFLFPVESGMIVAEGPHFAKMDGKDDCFYLPMETDGKQEHIFGKLEEQPWTFLAPENTIVHPMPEINAALTQTVLAAGSRFDFYDIASGKRTASVEIPGITAIDDVFGVDGKVWFTCGDMLYGWNIKSSPVEDEAVYTELRYHYANPDEEGLAAVGEQLAQIEQRFDVEIYYWNEVETLAPWDYTFEAEFLTEAYAQGLPALEKALSLFPEGFIKKAIQWTNSGKLHIVLLRGIYAQSTTEKYASAPGMQFTAEGDAYIALTLDENLEQWFYHEMGHLIDSRVLSTENTYSQWNKLNPWDFKYDNDYIKNQDRTDSKYLYGDKRHFVDLYSMSFAVEDRSRIFEYACMPGNEEVFASKPMQKKLKRVCDGIREAFDLKDETYIWEQYLK